jgi:hypothetical protein
MLQKQASSSFERSGTITYKKRQMYVCQLFGNFTNVAVVTPNGSATVSFDQIYLAGSAFSQVEILERRANVGIIELPLTYSSFVNDVYVNWTIGGYDSLRPIPTYYRANQTTYNTIVENSLTALLGIPIIATILTSLSPRSLVTTKRPTCFMCCFFQSMPSWPS